MFDKGTYIEGVECIGEGTLRAVRGWVTGARMQGDRVVGYTIGCDDSFNGNRENVVRYEYGNIVELPYKECPY